MRHTCVLAYSAKQKLDERVIDLFSPLLTQSRSSTSCLIIDSLKTVYKCYDYCSKIVLCFTTSSLRIMAMRLKR